MLILELNNFEICC